MRTPLITTIIPTYQRSRKLIKAIRSALEQTFTDIQICVYDNNSQDDTEEIVKQISQQDKRVKYYRHKTNIGPSKNFEFGLSQVQTPYFSFLSDDDVLLPKFYETALSYFTLYPDIGFSSGEVQCVTEDNQIVPTSYSNRDNEKEYFPTGEGFIGINTRGRLWTGILFHKKVLEKVSLDTSIVTFDALFVNKISLLYSCAIWNKPAAIFTVSNHSASAAFLQQPIELWKDTINSHNKLLTCLSNISIQRRKYILTTLNDHLCQRLYNLILLAIKQQNRQAALHLIAEYAAFNKKLNVFCLTLIAKYKIIYSICLCYSRIRAGYKKFNARYFC